RALPGRRELAAQRYLGEPWRAKLDVIEIPAFAAILDVGTHRREARAGERHAVDADAEARRAGETDRAAHRLRELADRGDRKPPRRLRQVERAVEVDLARDQRAGQARLAVERDLGRTVELDGARFGAVLQLRLLEQRAEPRRLDARRDAPRLL